MPYFVYRKLPLGALEPMGDFPSFKEAKELARGLRAELATSDANTVKIVFAETAEAAADLLSTPRVPPEDGDDY